MPRVILIVPVVSLISTASVAERGYPDQGLGIEEEQGSPATR